jgi:hypothetical protein
MRNSAIENAPAVEEKIVSELTKNVDKEWEKNV